MAGKQQEPRTTLSCPKCRNSDRSKIALLFPDNLVPAHHMRMFVSELTIMKGEPYSPKEWKEDKLDRMLTPGFFRCTECGIGFRLNKRGHEYVPRIAWLKCPKCGFNEPGGFQVISRDINVLMPNRQGWRKMVYYHDTLCANMFQCPKCQLKIIIDSDGREQEWWFARQQSS